MLLCLEVGWSLGGQADFQIPFLLSWNWWSNEGDKISTHYVLEKSTKIANRYLGNMRTQEGEVIQVMTEGCALRW